MSRAARAVRVAAACASLALAAACGAELPEFPADLADAGGGEGDAGGGGEGDAGGGASCADVCDYQFAHVCANRERFGSSSSDCAARCASTGGLSRGCMTCMASQCSDGCAGACGPGAGGDAGSGGACAALAACCGAATFDPAERPACDSTASGADDGACVQALASYEIAGKCP